MRTRRSILKAGLTGIVGSAIPQVWPFPSVKAAGMRRKLPVTAVVSVYTPNSHADVIVGKILEGYRQDGGVGPDLELVSLFTDQVPSQDMSREKAKLHGFRISETVDDALTFGTDRLQVAGVLCIAEHGDYELTPETGQRMYPRRRFFDDVVRVFRRCDQVVPVFNDKHLSYGCRAAPVLSCQADQLNSLRQRGFCVVARSPRLGQGELAVCNRSVHISCRSILHSSLVTPTAAHVSMIRDNVWLQPQRNKRSRNSLISRSRAASPPVCEASAHSCVPALHARTDRSTYRLRQETK